MSKKNQPTIEPSGDDVVDLYIKRKKIHPREAVGFFQTVRVLTIWLTLTWFYSAPWLLWDKRQALLFDLPERKFYIFGFTFWPQDFVYLAVLLIIAAIALFFFTALAGRIWCGYTCPQTVWTRLFIWIERLTEGNRNQRIRLDNSPWSLNKFVRRSCKHILWGLLAFLTAFTFVGYFTPIRYLSFEIIEFSLSSWEMFWIGFFSVATYVNAGWIREQVCLYMCPYARFQSVMFDSNTLVISYDKARGEPRGQRKKEADYKTQGLGDCVSCNQCVYVCPTGIDIRDGLQMACIGCAACIDACDSIMDNMNYPKGLIRYTTENKLEHKKSKILRPRLIIYGLLLFFLSVSLATALIVRVPFDLEIIRDRNQLYRETAEGLIENVYTLKIMNKSQQEQSYEITLSGINDMVLVGNSQISTSPGQVLLHPIRIQVDPDNLVEKRNKITIKIINITHAKQIVERETTLISPVFRR